MEEAKVRIGIIWCRRMREVIRESEICIGGVRVNGNIGVGSISTWLIESHTLSYTSTA